MKILVLIGSPRNGGTYSAVQNIESQMKRNGDVEFDEIWLKDVNLGQCRGCHACIRFGEDKCPLHNDLQSIINKIEAADGLIIASPVYALQVSYLVKTLFDQMSFLWHRPRFFGKFVMGVVSGGGQFKSTLGYIRQNAEAWGCTYVDGFGAPHVEALVPKKKRELEETYIKKAQLFYRTISKGKLPTPRLADLIRFRVWKINARAIRDFIPADFAYFSARGWFKRSYYTDQKIGLPGRILGNVMEKIIRQVLRSVYVGY